MRAIYIYCPETGLAVATGVISDERELSHSKLEGTISTCPACQDHHHWTASEAWLAMDRVAPPDSTNVRRQTGMRQR